MHCTRRKILIYALAGLGILLFAVGIISVNYRNFKEAEVREEGDGFDYFKSFSMATLDGGELSTASLAPSPVTMINVWTTTCGPCIKEMPEIEELSKEYASKGVMIIGVAGDYDGTPEILDEITSIVNQTGITYPTMLPDEGFISEALPVLNDCFPGTWFVDSKGNVISFYSGAATKDMWAQRIDEALKN